MTPTGPLVYALPGNEALAEALVENLRAEKGSLAIRQFPDEETYLRVGLLAREREVLIAATLDRPNAKLVTLYLLASTLRAAKARSVVLLAPYLPYMRQDRAFKAGESLSAAHIGRWLSGFLDALIAVDPHLHRIHALSEVYRIPTRVLHAAPAIGRWVRENVAQPLLIGPDEESGQWVADAAATANCPYLILKKLRHNDREVSIALPGVQNYPEHTPVLVDDIVSSGATMIEAVHRLHALGFSAPVCIAVHPVFAENSYAELERAGVDRIVSCNTVAHASNAIDLHRELAVASGELLADLAAGIDSQTVRI